MEVTWKLNGNVVATVTSPPWQWTMDCDNQYLVEEDYTDSDVENSLTATVRDLADGLVRSHLHSNPPFFDHDDHFWTQSWDIIWNGDEPDLMIRDFYQQWDNSEQISDVGDEPWLPFPLEGWFFDYTSDIKVSPATQGSTPFDDIVHESPLGSEITAYVNVRIENIGCSNFSSADKLHLYTSTNGGGLSWPSLWEGAYTGGGDEGYEITHDGTNSDPATIPNIDGGETAVVEIAWYIEDMTPNGEEDWNPCLLARIEGVTEDPIDGTSPAGDHLTNWIRFNNNIAMRNLTVDEPDGQGQNLEVIGGRPYSGGYTYLGNTGSTADTIDIYLQYGLQPSGSPDITDEAEVVIYFKENGWDVSDALDNASVKTAVKLDSTLYQATGDATFTGIIVPADTVVPVFIGFAFLTEEVGDSMNYVIHLNQRRSSSKDTVRWAQHYMVKRNTRNLFSADAGDDVKILSGDTTKLEADDIGEDALYFWLDANGDTLKSGDEMDVWPTTNTTYTLEVIAEDDGFKDYDDVTVTVTNGLITSVAPNPATSTTTVNYETTGVTTVKIKVVETATMVEVDNFTVTAGTGSKVITVSGYNSGTHIITLEGDSQDLDSETLIVQ
jgi:hypothetical protein